MSIEALFDLLGLLFDGVGRGIGSAIEKGVSEAGLRKARLHRLGELRAKLAACPLLPILGSPDGPAGFQGHARPLELCPAPLSGRRVIGYRLRLDAVFEEGEDKVTRRLLDVSSVQEFELVERDTGQVARVEPERCLPLLAPEPLVRLELADVIKPPLGVIVERALISTTDLVTAVAFRAVEHLLEPGEPVVAFGVASHELDPGGAPTGYRDVPRKTTLASPPDGVLIVADRHRDELLSALEKQWELLPEE